MRKYINTIFNNQIAKNMIMISGGTVFAQLIGILSMPIITRIYTPTEYGVLTVYISCIGLFMGSQSFRYELGIPIADDDKEATYIFVLSTVILLFLSFILFLLTQVASMEAFRKVSIEEIYSFRLLIPLGFLLTGLYQIFMMLSYRNKSYKAISTTKMTRSLGANSIKIILGLIGVGPIGLLLGYIFGQSSGTMNLAKPIKNSRYITNLNDVKLKKLKIVAIKFIKFPQYSLPSNFLNKAGDQIPVLFIASLYGSQVIGFYGLAKSIVTLPTMLIGNSIGDVFYGEASSIGRANPKELKRLSNQIFKKLFIVGMIPLVVLIFLAPLIFKIVFGESWYVAGIYARILSLWSFSQLVFQPVSRIYDIFGKQKEMFFITLMRIIIIFMIFFISKTFSFDSYIAISAYSVAMLIIYGTTYLFSLKILDDQIKSKQN